MYKIDYIFVIYTTNQINMTTNIMTTVKATDELQDETIEYSNYWNDENHLIASYSNTMIWLGSRNYTVSLVNNVNNKIVIKYQLPETRVCFGIMTCPDNNIFIYVHCNYINDIASIVIEIYNIIDNQRYENMDSLNPRFHNKINKLREFIIPSNTSCGSTTGVLQRVGNDLFNVIWGDLVNDEYVNLVLFDLNGYQPTQMVKDVEDMNDIADYYFITNNNIIQPNVIAINSNKLHIHLRSIKTNRIIIIQEVELPYTHRYDVAEVESSILEFDIYNKHTLCLIRVKLENKVDVLHIENYELDILMDIHTNSIISISQKIKNEFACKSSIYFIDDKPVMYTPK